MPPHDSAPRKLGVLPLAVGIAPIIVALLSAALAMAFDSVPRCIPFFEGCTSISATGRYPPASYVFKGFFLPYSVLLAAFWVCNAAWLATIDPAAVRTRMTVRNTGVLACVFLAVYVALLGSSGEPYEFMRRFGIYLFFVLTVAAQITTAVLLLRSQRFRAIARLQLGLCGLMVSLGILNLVLKQVLADPDPAENVIEWNFAVLMFANLATIMPAWHATGFRLRLSSTD